VAIKHRNQPAIIKVDIDITNTIVGDGREISKVVQQFLLEGYSGIS
jgi:hypothetical protein